MFILILVEYFLNFRLGELPVPHQEFINDDTDVTTVEVQVASADHHGTGSWSEPFITAHASLCC